MESGSRRTQLLAIAMIAAAVATVAALILVTLMLVEAPEPRDSQPEARARTGQSATDPIRVALESHPRVITEMTGRRQARGVFLCGYGLLGREGDTLYLYVQCGDFSTGPDAELLSGSAEPAQATTFGDTITAVTFPRPESLVADIRRLFPTDLAETAIVAGDRVDPAPSLEELRAEAASQEPGLSS